MNYRVEYTKRLLIIIIFIFNNSTLWGQTFQNPYDSPSKYLKVQKVHPPFFGFYSKAIIFDGIPIRSSGETDDEALRVACKKVELMLKKSLRIKLNLIQNGAEIHIIGKNERTSDLPEFKGQANKKFFDKGEITDIDQRARGMANIFASSGEENLLQLPSDRYGDGYDVLIHEFSHVIMNFGLDARIIKMIEERYQNAIGAGLWKGAYASENVQEYWAELSSWYFGYHGDYVRKSMLSPQPGPIGLKNYDLKGYNLLDSIYSGQLSPLVIHMLPAIKVSEQVKSTASKKKSQFTIVNNTSRHFKLIGHDPSGKSVPFADLLPYNHYMLQTFVSIVWEIKDDSGKSYGYYMAKNPNNQVVFN
jgi:hypothetical protein